MIASSFPGVLDLVFWIFIYTVIGMNFYLIDTKIGIPIHNWFKKMTSKNADEYQKVAEGFIYNRKLKSKIFHATWISALLSITVVWQGHSTIAVEIVMFTIEIPVVIFGFFIGPFYLKLLKISGDAVEKYDNFEKKIENSNMLEETKKSVQETSDNIQNNIEETANNVKEKVSKTYDEIKEQFTPKEEKPKKTLKENKESIDDILGKKY